jgi:hypothetical protein
LKSIKGDIMKISTRMLNRGIALGAVLLSLTAPIAAQAAATTDEPAAPATEVTTVSPEAQAVIDRMTSFMSGLKTFSIEGWSTRDEVVSFGYKLQHNEHSRLTIQLPDRLRVEVAGDIRNRTFVYNGSTLVMYSPDDAVFVRTAAPDTVGKLISGVIDSGIEMPMLDMLYQTYHGGITADARGGVLVGETTIDGVVCDHLAFRSANFDWQIWVEQGARPLPKKFLITTRYEVGDPQYQVLMRWNLQPTIEKSTFEFTPAAGVTEVPFVQAAALKAAAQ